MKKLLKYGVAALIGAAMTATYLILRDFTGGEPPAERYRMLCDAFTIPGVVLMLSAALVALSNEGSFTGIGYSMNYMFSRLIPGIGLRQETYADYLERREGKKIKGYGFLLQVGIVFMAVALVYYALFYHVFEG